jgi:hypothetical protein
MATTMSDLFKQNIPISGKYFTYNKEQVYALTEPTKDPKIDSYSYFLPIQTATGLKLLIPESCFKQLELIVDDKPL